MCNCVTTKCRVQLELEILEVDELVPLEVDELHLMGNVPKPQTMRSIMCNCVTKRCRVRLELEILEVDELVLLDVDELLLADTW